MHAFAVEFEAAAMASLTRNSNTLGFLEVSDFTFLHIVFSALKLNWCSNTGSIQTEGLLMSHSYFVSLY